jgi:hypothetical protein
VAFRPLDYFEDGKALYQLLQFDDEGPVLENCSTDEVLPLTVEDFAAMKLRRVLPEEK